MSQSDGSVQSSTFAACAARSELVFGPRTLVLPKVDVFDNVAEFSPSFAEHLSRFVYAERVASVDPVLLVGLPENTIVHGDANYLTTVGDVLLQEQIPPYLRDSPEELARALASESPIVDVEEECLLVARFGEWTWGHWAGELLARAVVAENAAPGRFKFAVPWDTTIAQSQHPVVKNVLGSLHAYGIDRDRLVRLERDRRYRFHRLAAVTSVWSYPYVMHPSALTLMRTSLRQDLPATDARRSVALLRLEGTGRAIQNEDQVRQWLRAEGFVPLDVGQMSFLEQVALMQQAEEVFGILGSSLTGLIYSPNGVRVLSVAPGAWADRFFYALIQARKGVYADVRGEPDLTNSSLMSAPFTPAIDRLEAGLRAIRT